MDKGELWRLLIEGAPPPAFWEVLDRARSRGVDAVELRDLEERVGLALQARARFQDHARRQEGLAALYETAVDMAAMHDVEAVLRAIVRRARQLLQSDTAYLTLNDQARGETYMRVSDGTITPGFDAIRLPFGAGLGGVVASRGSPFFTANYLTDSRLDHSTSVDAVVGEEGLVAIVGVPLLLSGDVIGVLFAADRRTHAYQPDEVDLLSSLAALAAVALEKARLFQDLGRAVDELHQANELVRAHSDDVEWAAAAHERLTSLVVGGGDLADLADAVADVFSAPVMILDHDGAVAATGPAGGDDPSPDLSPFAGWLADRAGPVARDAGSASAEPAAGECRETAIVAGERGLGVLVVARTSLSQLEQRAFERAAQATALLMLNQRAVADAEQRMRGELLEGLLSRHPDSLHAARRRAAVADVDLKQPHLVLALSPQRADRQSTTRAASAIAARHGGLASAHGDEIAVLLPAADASAARTFVKELSAVIGAAVTGAAAGPVEDPGRLPDSFDDARRCLQALLALGRHGEVADSTDFGFYQLLLRGRDIGEVREFVEAAIGPLLAYDRRRGTDLVGTLRTHLAAQSNVTQAAAALHVHVNTLYKRLERVTHLLGEGWDVPERRLQVALALELHQLSSP